MLWLWNFFRGYVMAEVTGFSAERFLNLAVNRGVYVWDVERTPNGLRLKVSVRGFKLLKGCARKSKCRVRIVGKQGWPFILFRYRKRKILMGGAVFFILALYGLSLFVWRVDVSGQERLSRDEVLAYAESRGLAVGAFKYAVGTKQLQREMMAQFPEIGFIDIHIKGTRASILIAETIPKQELVDKDSPCDIIAAKDGLITGIVTGAGRPMVKVNDVVRRGEVLVSGTLLLHSDLQGESTVPVHAYAEVWAKMYTNINFSIPLEYTEKAYTGRVTKRYAAQFLFADGWAVQFPHFFGSSIPYENYDRITYRRQPGVSGDYPLPVVFTVEEYSEFVPETRMRTVEEAMQLADRMVTSRILREFDFQADIIDKRVEFYETPDALYVGALITTNERIDVAVPVAPYQGESDGNTQATD